MGRMSEIAAEMQELGEWPEHDDYDYDCYTEALRTQKVYMALLAKYPDAYNRSPEQQYEIDLALSAKLKASYQSGVH